MRGGVGMHGGGIGMNAQQLNYPGVPRAIGLLEMTPSRVDCCAMPCCPGDSVPPRYGPETVPPELAGLYSQQEWERLRAAYDQRVADEHAMCGPCIGALCILGHVRQCSKPAMPSAAALPARVLGQPREGSTDGSVPCCCSPHV